MKRVLAVATLVASLTACGGGSGTGTTSAAPVARPTSTATVSIVSPKDGATIHGSTVEVRVRLEGGTIVPLTTTALTPNQGHLHITLDDALVSMTGDTSQTLTDVAPGRHLLTVEFVATDHLPFEPRVLDEVSFTVAR
ncbi:MAG: hypothetical protein ACXVQJ_09510 [Actinomycetota bacterium]